MRGDLLVLRCVVLTRRCLLPCAAVIRSVPAGTVDKVYCRMLSHSAVHGAFAGYSGFTAGLCSQHYVYLPSSEVVRSTRRMEPRGRLYRMMRAALGQPEFAP